MIKKAFTLIEILVALAIIALIMGASFSAFSGARASARDAKRKADLESIRSALELYRNEKGYYPTTNIYSSTNPNEFISVFISLLPKDPVSTNLYNYKVFPDPCDNTTTKCSTYKICSVLEIPPSGITYDVSGCNCVGACKYSVTNP